MIQLMQRPKDGNGNRSCQHSDVGLPVLGCGDEKIVLEDFLGLEDVLVFHPASIQGLRDFSQHLNVSNSETQ